MRERYVFTAICKAPDGIFEGDFDDLSSEHQELFLENIVKCESGTLNLWCRHCKFGVIEEDIEYISDDE